MLHGSYREEPQPLEKSAVDVQPRKRLQGGREGKGFTEEEDCDSLILKNSYDSDIQKHREGSSKQMVHLSDPWMPESFKLSHLLGADYAKQSRAAGEKAKGGLTPECGRLGYHGVRGDPESLVPSSSIPSSPNPPRLQGAVESPPLPGSLH